MKTESDRIYYLDALRAFAVVSVVFLCAFEGNSIADYSNLFNWFIADFVSIFFNVAVPLFLMISGALLFGRDWDLTQFLKRRIPRIVVPFVFWVIASSIFLLVVSYIFGFGFIDAYDSENILKFIYDAFSAAGIASSYYWFFWMILCVYLVYPVFDKWISFSNFDEIEYFLIFWIITGIFDYTIGISFPIRLSYFTSPIGLIVLGYYLRYKDNDLLNNPATALFLIFGACAVAMSASYILTNMYLFDSYSIVTVLIAAGIFLLFKNANAFKSSDDSILAKAIESLSRCSYGIFLVVLPVRVILEMFIIDYLGFYKAYVLILFVLCLFISWGIILVLGKVPVFKKLVGVN